MNRNTILLALLALGLFASLGCGPKTNDPPSDPPAEAGHDHAELGPHGGHLIELGRNHEYHAELVDDHKAGSATIYLLDAKLAETTTSESKLSLVTTAGTEVQTFEIPGAANDFGAFSQFSSSDPALLAALEHEKEATVTIRITINGTPFVGKLEHHEEGHGHSH